MLHRPARGCRGGQRGQATAELAVVLPVVVVLLLLVVQVGQIVRHRVMVVHTAREVVRAAAVSPQAPDAAGVAGRHGFDPSRLDVVVDPPDADGNIRATVTLRAPTDVALVGPLLPDVTVTAEAHMLSEWSRGATSNGQQGFVTGQ